MAHTQHGWRVEDIISGATGIVVGKITWLDGRMECFVVPEGTVDERPVEGFWCPENQLRALDKETAYVQIFAPKVVQVGQAIDE